MIDYTKKIPNKCDDDKVYFTDGIVYIISKKLNEVFKYEYECEKKVICPEYDDSISLYDIEMKYPDVEMVIFEDETNGKVYRFGNHARDKYEDGSPCELWECIGTTRGYA